MPQKTYIVTGGCGFIGSHLVDRIAGGARVVVIDNLSSGRLEFVERHSSNPDFYFHKADLLDLQAIKPLFKGVDSVFHFAANPDARAGITDTSLDLRLETIATYNVLEAMRVNGVKKIVFPSSGTVCGDVPRGMAVNEDYGPLLPISLYGAGKLACEGLITAFCHLYGMKAWIFRFANIIGPRATHGVIYDLILKLMKDPSVVEVLGDGSQEKPYLHVSDCVDAIMTVFNKCSEEVNLYNLGCDSTTSVSYIARRVVDSMELAAARIVYTGTTRGWPGDVSWFRYDISKISALWRSSMNSDQAVDKAVPEIAEELSCRL